MTSRDDELLTPVAVARVEGRARAAWTTCGGAVAVLVSLVGPAYGFTWPAVVLAVCLAVVVASAWAWLRTARTLWAASDRVRQCTGGRRSTATRWSRAVRDGRFAEVEPDETGDMVRWAEASVVHARLTPYGFGGLWLGLVLLQVVNLTIQAPPFADGPLARVLVVLLVVALFGTAWRLHRRNRLRLEQFLDGLDGPAR